MSGTIRTVSAAQVLENLNNPDRPILDLRPVDAYNGWRLQGEPRGGHIRSARSLPGKWAYYIDWPDILQAKDLRRDQVPILYGYDEADTRTLAERFVRAGFAEASVFPSFIEDWSARPSRPMSHLPRYRHLVPATWLRQASQNGTGHGRLVIGHAHYRNRGAYQQGHIPGAIALDTNWFESAHDWNRRETGELRTALQNAGITCDTTVVLYGRTSTAGADDPFPGSSAGQLGAMRCAHIMLYAGVRDVRVLNGGLQAWVDAGYETTTEESAPVAISDFGTPLPQRPELFVDLPRAKQILQSPGENLVCVRSWAEFTGQVSGYDYIAKKGRIPGAVFANCGSDAYHMENYRNVDETTREYHEIVAAWDRVGITPDKVNAFYCGTGWRASEAFFNAWLLAWPRIAVFDGGWFEWSRDEGNPIETGSPQT